MKKLITAKIIEGFAKEGLRQFPINDDTLITPSAKDLARNTGIKFVCTNEAYDNISQRHEKTKALEDLAGKDISCGDESDEISRKVVVAAVLEVLKEKGLLDKIGR
ncbi:MAG: hypothetical protein SOR72_05770 [Hornefia sp.]|nr:hypothetical protein [Hornefia sp.]